MPIFNPHLREPAPAESAPQGGLGGYETYGSVDNIIRQTRSAQPTTLEENLADALEAAFLADVGDLPALVAFINARNVLDAENTPWTEQTLMHFLEASGENR
jgi:hypothetical protein